MGVLDLAMIALMLVPTSAIFAAILLSISVYAKSYKEAAGMNLAADHRHHLADHGGAACRAWSWTGSGPWCR